MRFREAAASYRSADGACLPLGMGCATIGGGGDEATQRRYAATLETAYDLGLRYFDTSPHYGGSEFRVGRFLRGIDRSTVFVATKCPLPAALTPAEAARYIREGLRCSLERLGTDHIDLFQIHDVEELGQVLAVDGALEPLLEARATGVIRYLGLATRWHDLLETAVMHGAFDTILTYSDYTPLNQSAARIIGAAASRDVGVINGSPLGFGMLTNSEHQKVGRGSGDYTRYRGLATRLRAFAEQNDTSMLALALQYPMRDDCINMTLTGPASPDEVCDAMLACRTPVPDSVWAKLSSELGIPVPPAGV